MIYDCFLFNGEYDLLEIRFNVLKDVVDKFIIIEGMETFSGNPKVLYWIERNRDRFEEWENKVIYHIVSEYDDPEILKQMEERKAYVDQPAFQRAFYQKESIRKVLEKQNPSDEDIVIYGDADEIISPISPKLDDKVHKLRQLAYSYFLNMRSPEDWRGTIITKYKNLRGKCLNDMRAYPVEADILENGGWHFTNIGGLETIKRKLESYDHQEVNVPWVKDGLEERLLMGVDFLGRGFKFWKDESELPQYVLDNKARYKQIWKS